MKRLWLTVVGAFVAISMTSAGHAVTTPQQEREATVLDLAIQMARAELSGGVVAQLPAGVAKTALSTSPSGRDGTPFRLFLRHTKRVPLPALPRGTPAHEVIGRFAGGREHGAFTVSRVWELVPVLRERGTAGCEARLARVVRQRHADRRPAELIFAVVQSTTGARVPGGLVGTCLPRYLSLSSPVVVEPGQTLEEALNTVVASAPGTVWVAVQTENGRCGLGLVRASDDGHDACMVNVTGAF